MNSKPGLEIFAQDDAHVDPAEGVCLDDNVPGAEHRSNSARSSGITPPDDNSSETGRGVGVAEKNNIDSVGSQHPRGGPCRPLPPSAVQYFRYETALHWRNGKGVIRFRLALGSPEKAS